MMKLVSLGEDVLIYIISFLNPLEILRLSETCKALHEIAFLRIVWTNASLHHIIARGYPFSNSALDDSDVSIRNLVCHITRSYNLASRWHDGMNGPKRTGCISGVLGTVPEVRFLPGHNDTLLLIISKTIWSSLSIWYFGSEGSRKVCEWSPRGAIFSGFAVNSNPRSEATIAVAVHLNDEQTVKVLSLIHDDSQYELRELHDLQVGMKPVTLSGDLLALSDDFSQTAIWHCKTGHYGLLQHSSGEVLHQINECIQVIFAPQSVLVVRAQNIHLFPFPNLESHRNGEMHIPHQPLAQHSFGWVDGESVNVCPFLPQTAKSPAKLRHPLTILVRGESDDPWASDIYNLELYTLYPNPDFISQDDETTTMSPYLFPPRLTSKVACLRGSLTCRRIMLGRLGTAVWIQPRDRFAGGLLADIPPHLVPSTIAHESLIATVFPGSLCPARLDSPDTGPIIGRKIFGNDLNNSWTSFDYDEESGRIALASSFGKVTILEL